MRAKKDYARRASSILNSSSKFGAASPPNTRTRSMNPTNLTTPSESLDV